MNQVNEIRPVDVVLVAQRLAGCSDERVIVARFSEALRLIERAAEVVELEDEETMLRAMAEADDEENYSVRTWDDPRILEIAGGTYTGKGGAKRLKDAVRNGLRRRFPEIYRMRWLNGGDLSRGISLASFRILWPKLSDWRRG